MDETDAPCTHNWQPVSLSSIEYQTNLRCIVVCLECDSFTDRILKRA